MWFCFGKLREGKGRGRAGSSRGGSRGSPNQAGHRTLLVKSPQHQLCLGHPVKVWSGVTRAGRTGPGVLQAGAINKGVSLEGQIPTDFSRPFPANGQSIISIYGKIINSRLQEPFASPSRLLIILQLANKCSWEIPSLQPSLIPAQILQKPITGAWWACM